MKHTTLLIGAGRKASFFADILGARLTSRVYALSHKSADSEVFCIRNKMSHHLINLKFAPENEYSLENFMQKKFQKKSIQTLVICPNDKDGDDYDYYIMKTRYVCRGFLTCRKYLTDTSKVLAFSAFVPGTQSLPFIYPELSRDPRVSLVYERMGQHMSDNALFEIASHFSLV